MFHLGSCQSVSVKAVSRDVSAPWLQPRCNSKWINSLGCPALLPFPFHLGGFGPNRKRFSPVLSIFTSSRGAAGCPRCCSVLPDGSGAEQPPQPPFTPPPPAVCCWPWLPGCSGGAVGRWLQLMVIAPHPQRGPRGRPTASDLIHAGARDACGAGGMWGRGGELRAHRCAPWHRAVLVALRVPASGAVMATRCPPTPGL